MAPRISLSSTAVEGCKVLDTAVFEDVRGFFCEAWNLADFQSQGLPTEWPQDNLSWSKAGVARGLHIQRNNPQGKLVRALSGRIIDFCYDLRLDSPTFGALAMVELHGGRALYCPPGTAHGFVALTDALVYYKCTTLYDKASDGGINMKDPKIGVPLGTIERRIFSNKDLALPTLEEWLEGRNL